jgi:hypothetical protein
MTSTMLSVNVDRTDPILLHDQVAAEIRRAVAEGEERRRRQRRTVLVDARWMMERAALLLICCTLAEWLLLLRRPDRSDPKTSPLSQQWRRCLSQGVSARPAQSALSLA